MSTTPASTAAASQRSCLGPRENAVERGLLHDHPAVAALRVDAGWVPEPEEIVGPARRGVQEVEGPGIDRELLERFGIEVGPGHELRRSGAEDVERGGDQVAVAAMGRPYSGDEQRQGPHPLVRIRLGQAAVLEHGDGPPADVVVEPVDRGGGVVAAGGEAGEHGLGRGHHEEGPLERTGRLVREQVAVEPAILRQHAVEDEVERGAGLRRVAKRRRRGLERGELLPERCGHDGRRIGPLDDALRPGRLGGGEQSVESPPGRGIVGSRGEVEIPEHDRGEVRGGRRGRGHRVRPGVVVRGRRTRRPRARAKILASRRLQRPVWRP
jgi:hypothetical protein